MFCIEGGTEGGKLLDNELNAAIWGWDILHSNHHIMPELMHQGCIKKKGETLPSSKKPNLLAFGYHIGSAREACVQPLIFIRVGNVVDWLVAVSDFR